MKQYIIILACILAVLGQQTLELGHTQMVSLTLNQTQDYQLQIPKSNLSAKETDLFIFAEPVLDNPSQIPSIKITLTNGSTFDCLIDSDELEGICRLPINSISESITITLQCEEDCSFWLDVYLNNVISLDLDKQYLMKHKSSGQVVYEFDFQIPEKEFDKLRILLKFMDQGVVGAEMFANVGNSKALQPDVGHYQYKAEPAFEGIAIDLPQVEVPSGTWVKLSIFTTQAINMELSASIKKGNSFCLSLYQTQYDQVPKNTAYTYNISLLDFYKDFNFYDITVEINIYAGYPEIYASFDPSFNNSLENQGIGGNLIYLLTPSIRQKYGFKGIIYLEIQAFSYEVSFRLSSTAHLNDYTQIVEASSYLEIIELSEVKNFIYNLYYIAPKNISNNFLVYFTVKIHMLEGGILYYSRICPRSDKECMVTKDGLNDDTFRKQVRQLPGELLKYYNNYQIYQWTQLSQCKKQSLNSTSDTYHCKVHIVAYNHKYKDCKWVMTTYSRQNNIELKEGHPFKDKVIQTAYNYYQFIAPTTNYQSITVFLTLLTGEAEIISSLKYTKPQFMFFSKDTTLKIGSRNQIVYQKKEINKGKIYIGVYGDSMAEYMINVVIKRQNKSTAISLPPQVGQLFRLSPTTFSMTFKLSPSSAGQWKVDFNAINANLDYVVSKQQKGQSICTNSECLITSTGQDQFYLQINRGGAKVDPSAVQKQIKFTAAYYPKNQCRLLPLGTPSFISIPTNGQQCIQYIIDGRQTIVAFSRNILSSLTRHINLTLTLNNKTIGQLDQHYSLITQKTIQMACNDGEPGKTARCILMIMATGSKEGPTDMWLTVVLTQSGIPLFSGVVLPFNKYNLTTPLRFYYESIQNSQFDLVINSFTYEDYNIEWVWINQISYLNADKDDDIYPALGKGSKPKYSLVSYRRRIIAPMKPTSDCQNCILLISIFPKKTIRQCSLELQIIGSSISLDQGETRKGSLEKEESVVFSFLSVDKQTIVSLNHYDSSSCFRASMLGNNSQMNSNQLMESEIIVKAGMVGEIQLVGVRQSACNFQISRWSTSTPLRNMKSQQSYIVKLKNSSTIYFLYFHTPKESFRVYEVITSGSLYSYATPLLNSTLQQTLALSQSSYLFGSKSPYEDLYVSSEGKGFCHNCYYLIKIIGAPSAQLQMGVSDPYTPVVLTNRGVVRQKLSVKSTRIYKHFSTTSFTLRLTIVTGQVHINVTDYYQNQLYYNNFTSDSEIEITNTQNFYNMYQIIIKNDKTTMYAIQVIGAEGVRLIEGYSNSYYFKQNNEEPFVYKHSTYQNINLNVMLEYVTSDNFPQVSLKTYKTQKYDNGSLKQNKPSVTEGSRSGNIVFFYISAQPAQYTFIISFNKNTSAKVLIARNQLTYLPPNLPYYVTGDSIFQIDTKGYRVMLQAFPCYGDLTLSASEDYADMQGKNKSDSYSWSQPVTLEHNNIAGHYVANSMTFSPEYYAKVKGQKYRVSYSYIDDDIPYRYFTNVKHTMESTMNKDGININFQVPLPKFKHEFQDLASKLQIIYGKKEMNVKAYAQCLVSTAIIAIQDVVKDYPPQENKYSVFVDKNQLNEGLVKSEESLFFGMRLVISYQKEDAQQELIYLYEPLELSMKNLTIEEESSFSWVYELFLWGLVLIIAGGVLLVAGKCCWKSLKQFKATRGYILQEEQDCQTDTFHVMSKKQEDIPSIQT